MDRKQIIAMFFVLLIILILLYFILGQKPPVEEVKNAVRIPLERPPFV